MTRAKFRLKRLRMDKAADSEDEFNFESDDEDVESTAAAMAAAEVPEEKLTITETLQSSGKRKRMIDTWEKQSQWKIPSVGVEIKPWGSWLGKMKSSQNHSPSPVARLPANVVEKRGVSCEFSMWSSCSARKCANKVEVLDKSSTRTGRVRSVVRPKFLVMRGDPTDWRTEAIVNSANSLLHHNYGLSATIVKKGGLEIQRQSSEWVFYNGEVSVGSAMWTTAGKLPNKFIIHTIGPDVRNNRWPTQQHQQELRQTVRSALSLADELGVTSVAIPALCTGISCYPKYLAAREIVAECLEYCDDCPMTTLRLIVFMNEDAVTTSIFVQALKNAREHRQQERRWSSVEHVQAFGTALDCCSDDSSLSDWTI